jgi:hypothetical protein
MVHLQAALKRGAANYRLIESRVIGPVLDGRIELGRGIDGLASPRVAALIDPEGEALARCISEIERQTSLPIAAE